jgi:hypothetical protein
VTTGLVLWIVVWFAVPAFVGNAMGEPKARSGWAYGLLLGWIGIAILALLPPRSNQGRRVDR